MRKLEQIQGQALLLLETEGDMTTHQLASMATPVCSNAAMAIALNQLKIEGEIKKKGLNWTLVDGGDHADAS